MTTSTAINLYVKHKQLRGVGFEKGKARLLSFCRSVNDKELHLLSSSDVVQFLGDPRIATVSWRSKHMIIARFVQFWVFRDAMSLFEMPPIPAPVRCTFVPYIYSKGEVRRLIRATRALANEHPLSSDVKTIRLLVILLYGTGAFVGQILNLQWKDVDLEGGFITLRQKRYERSRTIPLAPDLVKLLGNHMTRYKAGETQFVLTMKTKRQMSVAQATVYFQRLRAKAGILRTESDASQPRLHDLRSTFAVHRIDEWIREGKDLNRMLPALSAYMGLTGLMNSERFLAFAPNRFRQELDELSPSRKRRPWREDPVLMRFLASL